MYALASRRDIQTKLREELLSVTTETPSYDELMALPYLDAVVRETLRLHPAIPAVPRVASKDDVIPLDEPFTNRNGKIQSEVS